MTPASPRRSPATAAFAALGAALLLSACGVTSGAGRDVSTAGNALSNAATATQQGIHRATGAATQ